MATVVKSYPFTTPANYTYDSAKIDVTGGLAKLNEAADTTAFASYDVDIDLTYSLGSATGTATGGASVGGGVLDLTGGTLQYVTYSATGNADSTQVGCIRFTVTPAYSGSPAADRSMIILSTGATGVVNAVWILHTSAGNLVYYIYDSAGSTIANAVSAAWSPTASTDYEIELNWDITTGANRIFVDGTQLGTTNTSTGTRTAADTMKVGTNAFNNLNPDFSINNLHIFSTVQHTANYTPGDLLYVTDNPIIYPVDSINADALSVFAETSTATGSDAIRFTINVDGSPYYWTGAAWAVSNATYAQTSTASDISTNIATLISSGSESIYPNIYLHSNDGTTSPSIDIVSLTYNFWAAPETAPNKCVLWGYIYDSSGNPLENQKVIAYLQNTDFTSLNQLIPEIPNYVETDSTGLFTIDLIWTSEIPNAVLYNIEVRYTGYLDERYPQTSHTFQNITIPDQVSVEFKDL